MRVLAVGAHPDDVELGCGGTLLRHHERRDEITVLVMTGGERGVYDARSRQSEQQVRGRPHRRHPHLGWVRRRRGADRGPKRSRSSTAPSPAPAPRSSTPTRRTTAIRITSPTSSICLAAARRVPTVLYYETPSTLEFMPTVFTDLDDVMERKIALVARAPFPGAAQRTGGSRRSRRPGAVPRFPEPDPARRGVPARTLPLGPAQCARARSPHARPSRNQLASTTATELRAISEVAGSLSR